MDSESSNPTAPFERKAPVRKIITEIHTVLSPEEYKAQEEIKQKVDWYAQLRSRRSPEVDQSVSRIQGFFDAFQDPEISKIVDVIATKTQAPESRLPASPQTPPAQAPQPQAAQVAKKVPERNGNGNGEKRGWRILRNLFKKK